MNARLLTKQNLDEGFVEIPVEFLTGDSGTIKLTAPAWRKRRELILNFQQALDTFIFVNECLRPCFGGATDQVERFLNQLTPDALARVEMYAVALTLGENYQKKMQEAGKELIEKMAEAKQVTITSAGSEPNAPLPGNPAATSKQSGAGRGRGSN